MIARPRPFETYAFIHNLGNEDGFSMPSGHSMCSGLFATYLIYNLFQCRRDVATRVIGTSCLSMFAILIAFSRVVLGAHYITDTIIGIIIGITFAILSIWLYNISRKVVKKRSS